ncbi:DUF4446 family protein [Clostridium thailandense]|uniref:DUF4446 family protein n=1 Tax=Clostridium thailandense TaxID=2794346 RepID=A0A949TMU6_9CLOT|nr:DUF4446 family protein [Clostridium thailandense]MBV7275784.1 DUF4446 family protein [Clostridium thailandense]
MKNIIGIINGFQVYIIAALAVLVIILFIMLMVTLKSLSKLENKYRRFMRGVDNKNLEELIVGYLDKVDEAKAEAEYMKKLYENLNLKLKECIQKVSIIRYRAFEDVGSDLSFSIALLDDSNSGVIVTGIYGRNESTTYAKPIDRGISRYDLSQEEQHVLQECINKVLS